MNRTLFLIMLCVMALPDVVFADLGPLNRMINPGKVSKAHAKIENECGKCHIPFKKAGQVRLCVECHDHKDIAQDIRQKRGYHGRVQEQLCNACHTEHKGRANDITSFNKQTFNHDKTDFPLTGKHAGAAIKCADCHQIGEKYRQAPAECYACHRDDDEHQGSLGKKCGSCHGTKDWKKTWFDHSKTRFPLKGEHKPLECKACHTDHRYKDTPRTCYACHRTDDVHKGHEGRQCEKCHNEYSWKKSRFDHSKTRFPLKGKHRGPKCKACHKGQRYKDTFRTCYACHKADDSHKGQEGKRCGQCHNEYSWNKTLFDHGQTKFPLLGKHKRVKCKECHKDPKFKDAPGKCIGCHKDDDEHRGRLGTKCQLCHNSRSWKAWKFNHNKQTDFVLDGGHKGLHCEACHIAPTTKSISLSGTCVSCHQNDDIHDGEFGEFCERCHVTSSFRKIKSVIQLH